MSNDSEMTSSFSPKTMRVLWLIAAAASVLAMGLTVWAWVRKGRFEWVHIFNPLGIFLMSLGALIDPKHGILYRVMIGLALVFIIIGVVSLLMFNR